jgi:hypothetical protein
LRLWETKIKEEPIWQHFLAFGIDEGSKKLGMRPELYQDELMKIRYLYDIEKFAEDKLKIIDKNGDLIPFRFNNCQRKLNEAVERQQLAGKAIRICLLKCRQFGGSTYFQAKTSQQTILRHHRSSMTIAHDLDSARHLREMSIRFYENYEAERKAIKLYCPKIKKETDKWYKINHFVNRVCKPSSFRIDTAEELSTGHSITLHNLHLSELQLWRNAPELMKGLIPTVPNSPDTMIFLEGTGSGVGDYWYERCEMAKSDPEWEFVFVAWFEMLDYQNSFVSEYDKGLFETTLDEEEKLLVKEGITLEQLQWRRNKIKELNGDEGLFRQQYPHDAEESFLTSGRPVFHPLKVKQGLSKSVNPIKVGNLEWNKEQVIFTEMPQGLWEIWEEPVKDENLYVLGADSAQGIAVIPEFGNKGGDYSVAKVFRRDVRKFVGRLRNRIAPEYFAEEIHKASKYWNCAVMPTVKGGEVVIDRLKDVAGLRLLRMPNLGKREDGQRDVYGWVENKDTKRMMIDELAAHINANDFIEPSKNLWYEASTYVRDEKGSTNAQLKKYDDEVTADAVCFQADKLLPMYFRETIVTPDKITPDMDCEENWDRVRGEKNFKRQIADMFAEF